MPGGVAGILSTPRAARILRGIRPQGSSARIRRRLASEIIRDIRTLERKITDLNERIEAEVEASATSLIETFVRHRSRTGRQDIGTVGSVARFQTKAHFASYSGTAPVEASSGEMVRHRLSLAGNRNVNVTRCTWSQCARLGRTPGVEPTTSRRWQRTSPVRRRLGASKDASPMPFSRA